jgi:pimeloyl-ACP methyl ester carboxylesterase
MGWIGTVKKKLNESCYRCAVGAQEPRGYVEIGDVRLAFTDSGGSGPVIICLHAIGHGARDFEKMSEQISPDYRVIALDFPGHGNSGDGSQPASATRYAEILGQFIDQLHLDSFTLLGNSIGGATAIRYAAEHPERVTSLVLCDSGGLGVPDKASRVFIGAFVQFFAAGRRRAIWFPWAFDWYYNKVLVGKNSHQQRDRIVRSAYEIAPVLEQAWRSFARPQENLGPILSKV